MADEHWREVPLGEVVTLKRGYDLPTRERQPGPFPVVSSSGFTGTHDEAKVGPPGVVTGRYGTLGEVYFVDEPFWPLNTTLYVQDFKGNDPLYVAYLLESLDLPGLVASAAVPGINRNHLHPLPVRIPEVRLQREFAAAVAAFDRLIQNNRRRIEILEEMTRVIYREWFVHFRFPGHEHVGLLESELGPIPEDWDVTSLAEHVELQRENVQPAEFSDEEFDHYSIPAFDADRLPVVEAGSEIKSGKYRLDANCVLLSKLNPRFPRVWRASPGRSKRRSICSTEFLVLEATGDWPDPFVFSLVSDADFGARVASMAGGTSTSHQRAGPKDVMALPAAGPPTQLVATFSDRVRPMLDLADILVLQNDLLSKARDLLLPRLISGELDVSGLDLDLEPVA